MITLMVNYYAESPASAIESAKRRMPIDRVVKVDGRYEGFEQLIHRDHERVYASEHAKRNAMLELAGPPDPDRWLFWLDCDERVIYGSPMLAEQLQSIERLPFGGDVAGVRFIEPLDPASPGLQDPRRSRRDHVIDAFPRLIRHLPGLRYDGRHDYLIDGDHRLLVGWSRELPMDPDPVDVIVVHLRDTQTRERVRAKRAYYASATRADESTSPLLDRVAESIRDGAADDEPADWTEPKEEQ